MPKQKLQWSVERVEHGGYCAMLWDGSGRGIRLASTRWVTTPALARKDGRKVFAQHAVRLSAPEIRHLLWLLWDNKLGGSYYGPHQEYDARQERLIARLKEAVGED